MDGASWTLNHKYLTRLICTIPCWAASNENLTLANQMGKRQQPDVANYYRTVPSTVPVPSYRHICFSTELTFDHASLCEIPYLWDRHCGISTTKGRHVALNHQPCAFRGLYCKKKTKHLKLSLCLWSARVLKVS